MYSNPDGETPEGIQALVCLTRANFPLGTLGRAEMHPDAIGLNVLNHSRPGSATVSPKKNGVFITFCRTHLAL